MAAETRNPYAGQLNALDLEREPGPQFSQASERSWRIVDRLILVSVCLYILGIAGGLL